jgi:thiol-disulfide isomerase/thioredoxin
MIWGAAYLAQRPVSIPADQLKVESTSETGPSTAGNRETTGAAGSYIDYSESAIASTKDTKILFFYAPWCPQCRAIEADIKKLGVPAGVTIIKVDYDSNQALRQKYGVTIQTTLVRVDDDGNLVKKYVAYQEPTLASVKENLL